MASSQSHSHSPSSSPSSSRSQSQQGTLNISTKCSFADAATFADSEQELARCRHETSLRALAPLSPPSLKASGTSSPKFLTTMKPSSAFTLQLEAARCNDGATRSAYQPPSNHEFRAPVSPGQWRGEGDFQTKFHLCSNQDVRLFTARDQEGFFMEHSSGGVHGDDHDARATASSPKPPFQSRVPHTARKSATIARRLEVMQDQQGLLPQLREIHSHRFRDEPPVLPQTAPGPTTMISAGPGSPAHHTRAVVPFYATFKPASPLRPMGSAE